MRYHRQARKMSWKKTITLKALEGAGSVSVRLDDKILFLTRFKGNLYAVDGACSHSMEDIGSRARCILGFVDAEDGTVRCTCHNAVFDLLTGRMIEPPSVAKDAQLEGFELQTYGVRESGRFIEVDVPDSN